MKNLTTRSFTALALAASLGLSVPATALAATSKTSTSTASATTAVDVLAWKTWHATWMTYSLRLRSNNLNYRVSVENARSAFTLAMTSAKTRAARLAARTNLNAAMIAAINARVNAITAAGNPPAPPAGFNGSAFVSGFQTTNVAFRAAVSAAQTTYAQALLSAATEQQRVAARTALRVAINNAITARATALAALGTPPENPGRKSA